MRVPTSWCSCQTLPVSVKVRSVSFGGSLFTNSFAGGSSEVQFVQQSNDTSCLETASTNATEREFTFTVSGVAQQCNRGFELSWSGQESAGPYNFTVIPLDQKFFPYDVVIEDRVHSLSDWQLNMTEGSKFTVMMNNAHGYGTGGVAQIYSVSNGSSADCVSQSVQPSGTWPVGLATNTLAPGTLKATEAGQGKGLSGGAIAGTVIGVLVAVGIIVATLFFFIRRYRARHRQLAMQQMKQQDVDLVDDDDEPGEHVPMVEPFNLSAPAVVPAQQDVAGRPSTHSTNSAGFAGLGAGEGGLTPDEEVDRSGENPTSQAGPLPRKSTSSLEGLPRASASSANNGMRITNNESEEYPPLGLSISSRDDRYDSRRRRDAGPTYRRHEDAGRILQHPASAEVVDLPPLYSDVPHEEETRSPAAYTPNEHMPSPTSGSEGIRDN